MAGKTKFDDRVWQKLRKELGKAADRAVRVGLIGSKGGNETTDSGFTIVEVGAVHEFGSSTVPKRSFIIDTFDDKRSEQAKLTAKLTQALMNSKITIDKALDVLGLWGVNEVKSRIVAGIDPELKDATKDRKGSPTPLIDTGRMINAITHEIERPD
jgi:hypothetical protein